MNLNWGLWWIESGYQSDVDMWTRGSRNRGGTASLFARLTHQNWAYHYQKFDHFFKWLIKSWFFKVINFIIKKGSIASWKTSKTSLMLFGNYIFCTIKNFNPMINRKRKFVRNKYFAHSIVITYNKFRSTLKVEN